MPLDRGAQCLNTIRKEVITVKNVIKLTGILMLTVFTVMLITNDPLTYKDYYLWQDTIIALWIGIISSAGITYYGYTK